MGNRASWIGAATFVALTSCHWVAPYESTVNETPDAARSADGALADARRLTDAALDRALLDSALRDASSGGEQPSVLADGEIVSDFAVADAVLRADAGIVSDSAPPDGPVADAAPPPGPCAHGTVGWAHESEAMVLCDTAPFINQCGAPTACNGDLGWSLCTATRYATLYAAGPPPPVAQNAWLAACVRNGDTVQQPTASDAVCSACPQLDLGSGVPIAWRCGGGSATDSPFFRHLGVVSGSECRRLGVNSITTTEAHWRHLPAGQKISRVLCCADLSQP